MLSSHVWLVEDSDGVAFAIFDTERAAREEAARSPLFSFRSHPVILSRIEKTPTALLAEWLRGCSNADAAAPWRCRDCTVGLLRALSKRLLQEHGEGATW